MNLGQLTTNEDTIRDFVKFLRSTLRMARGPRVKLKPLRIRVTGHSESLYTHRDIAPNTVESTCRLREMLDP